MKNNHYTCSLLYHRYYRLYIVHVSMAVLSNYGEFPNLQSCTINTSTLDYNLQAFTVLQLVSCQVERSHQMIVAQY